MYLRCKWQLVMNFSELKSRGINWTGSSFHPNVVVILLKQRLVPFIRDLVWTFYNLHCISTKKTLIKAQTEVQTEQ